MKLEVNRAVLYPQILDNHEMNGKKFFNTQSSVTASPPSPTKDNARKGREFNTSHEDSSMWQPISEVQMNNF